MAKNCIEGAHLETEKGYRISSVEHGKLKSGLPARGFAFLKKSRITDFVAPSQDQVTRRMRIENIMQASDGITGIRCIRCYKNHPIKGRSGRNVRMEDEKCVKPATALAFVLNVIDELDAPVPYYSKMRWLYRGVYEGLEMTISLDHATGIGAFSGCYIEIETLMPLSSSKAEVRNVLRIIEKLAVELLGGKRKEKISYRKMLAKTWSSKNGRGKNNKRAKATYRKLVNKVAVSK